MISMPYELENTNVPIKDEPVDDDATEDLDAVLSFLTGTLAPDEDHDSLSPEHFVNYDERPRSPQWISGDDMEESDCTSASSSPPHSPPQDSSADSVVDSIDIPNTKSEYNFDDSSTHQNLFDDDEVPHLFSVGSTDRPELFTTNATERRQQRIAKMKEARKRANSRVKQKPVAKTEINVPLSPACVAFVSKIDSSQQQVRSAEDTTQTTEEKALSKKEKRRLDNRRSAELSRKRKRDRLELLERQVKFLKAQSEFLSARLSKYEHVDAMPLFEDASCSSPSTPVYRNLGSVLGSKFLAARNKKHMDQQQQTQKPCETFESTTQSTMFEQCVSHLTVFPILHILVVLAATSIAFQMDVVVAAAFALVAYWVTITDIVPAQSAKIAVVAGSVAVTLAVLNIMLQPGNLNWHAVQQENSKYCLSPNLA
jgi:hypothetical protein